MANENFEWLEQHLFQTARALAERRIPASEAFVQSRLADNIINISKIRVEAAKIMKDPEMLRSDKMLERGVEIPPLPNIPDGNPKLNDPKQ